MNYERIAYETAKQHTINTNQYADAIRDINRLKETADRLNQENCSLKKKYSLMFFQWLKSMNLQIFVTQNILTSSNR